MTETRARGPASADRSLGWRVGSIAGVPIYLSRSWFIIGALIVWSWGPSLQGGTTLGGWAYVLAFGFAVALMLSVLAHEVAHALSAKAVGMPAQHIALTLWGGHTQFHNETPTPGRGFVVAAAGPAANLALGAAAWWAVDVFDTASAMARLVGALAWANLFVGGFNLLPGLPLDGGAMLEALIWKVTGSRSIGTRIAAYIGLGTAASVFVWAVAPVFAGEQPGLVRVVIGGAIAVMLFSAARQSLQQARWRGRAQRLSLRALARPAVGIADHVTLAQAHGQVPAGASLVVIAGGTPMGIVDPHALSEAMAAGRWGASMSSVAQVIDAGAILSAQEDGEQLLRTMADRPTSPHVLVEAGQVVAVVWPADVIRAMEGA